MSQSVAAKPPPLSSNVRLIGRYTVQRELRRDRYTAVYLASDPVLNRQLIVKAVQLHPAEGQDRTAHERIEQAFMRQAQAAGRLHHPHIVTVFDAGHVNRLGYLALEKVDGKLLDELLAEGYKPGHLQAADIVARVADAVEFAHARAIPHGHLSPSRIYLQGPERLPKVTGFGGWIDSGMTGDFELHGTDSILPFFGDELAGEARRKDVRALGALLYLLLTGTRPDVKTLRAQRKGAESPILLLRPTTPLALAEIAEQALELGGSRVYTTAGQVRNALTTYLWGNRGGLPLPGLPRR
jgi:eukaryotic-like serine/threonine-protein kinase